jgi:hypothetical protein
MKLPKITILFLTILLSSFLSVYAQTPYYVGSDDVVVTASVSEDSISTIIVSPDTVEVKEPSIITVTMKDGEGNPVSNRYIQIVADGLTFVQPTQPSDEDGVILVEVYGLNPGSFTITANDITEEVLVIDILDTDTLYVTPVPAPTLNEEPQYTRGTSNTLSWDSLGPQYQYYIEVSRNSSFSTLEDSSGWINVNSFEFNNLQNGQMYFYRVKARNTYGGESEWSNVRFSVQDSEAPTITVISIGDIGENNTVEWESNYEIEIVYKVEDNLSVDSVEFYCVRKSGSQIQCGDTVKNGVVYTTTINLGELEKDGINNIYSEYTFCIQATDSAGNSNETCDLTITVPQWVGEEDEEKPPKEVPTTIDRIIKDFIDDTEIVIDDIFKNYDDYTLQDIGTTATVATITFSIATLIGGFLSLPLFLFQLILNLITLLGLRKKGKLLGYVYDSKTKEPISQAIVRVYDENNKLVWTDVTDDKGVFELALDDGEYTIKVTARNYQFPSKVIYGKSDYPLENVYHGEEFKVKDGEIPEFSIPLDSVDMSIFDSFITSISNRLRVIYKVFTVLLFVFGLIFSIYIYYKYKTWFNFFIILLYIPSFVLVIRVLFKKNTKYGIVKDEEGNRLENISVGLRDTEFDDIVSKRVTDKNGRYRFVVEEKDYQIQILETGYELVSLEDSRFDELSDGSLLIALDIVVKPIEVEK